MSDSFDRFIAIPGDIYGLYFPGKGSVRGSKPVRKRSKRNAPKDIPGDIMGMGEKLQAEANQTARKRAAKRTERLEAEERRRLQWNRQVYYQVSEFRHISN